MISLKSSSDMMPPAKYTDPTVTPLSATAFSKIPVKRGEGIYLQYLLIAPKDALICCSTYDTDAPYDVSPHGEWQASQKLCNSTSGDSATHPSLKSDSVLNWKF